MTVPRLYVHAELHESAEITAASGQAHYLAKVLRRAIGDSVLLFNGRDGEWRARIVALRRDQAVLAAQTRTRLQEPEPDLWLVFALLKRNATDLVVQKATELGASALLPARTTRTNTVQVNETRLRCIAIEAAEQSERLTVPIICQPRTLPAILADWPSERRLYAAVERSEPGPLPPARGPAALLVGPEGGFTSEELDALRLHAFVALASLGPRVLRAETACLAGLVLLQAAACG
ncbi:MAG: 16S rRNA (uracil(1498)-N(3))-methyltransferase [Acetobacteraceae bacterium]|nr:16S rRNA (uracil(1498)-N(3))-methyltransferase [Acetobacteraceae bacterium]